MSGDQVPVLGMVGGYSARIVDQPHGSGMHLWSWPERNLKMFRKKTRTAAMQ